jgi:hypothetical protein
MQWIFDPTPPSENEKGESPFGAMLEDAANNIGSMESLFVRETIANSADQRKVDNSHPVNLYIDFIEVFGDAKKNFKTEFDWSSFSKHVKASMGDIDGESNPTQSDLQSSYSNMGSDEEKTLLVRVSDFNANGLVGDETDKNSNFFLFCKSVFKTSKDSVRQGSFGLGKGVLYHQSCMKTVLMSSYCNVDGKDQMRVFGRAELPSHRCKEGSDYRGTQGCDGPGFFGIPEQITRGTKAISSITETDKTLDCLFLNRDRGMGTGTSAISLSYKLNGTIDNTIAHFKSNIQKWFWPALCKENKPITVTIRRFENHKHLSDQDQNIKLEAAYKVFAKAYLQEETSKNLNYIGNIASKELNWDIPKKKTFSDPNSWNDGKAFSGKGLVKLYRSDPAADTQNISLNNSIALLRNNLCVVQYLPITIFSDDNDSNFYGVFLAGDARGESLIDKKFADFLRSSEPPLHNNWKYKHKIENIYDFTKPTAHAFLNKIENNISDAANSLADIKESENSDSLDHLASLFKFGSSGTVEGTRFISDKVLNHTLDGREILVTIQVNNLRDNDDDWKVETLLSINAINSKENNLVINNLSLDDSSLNDRVGIDLDGRGAEINISPEISSLIYTIHATIPNIASDEMAERQDYKLSVVSRN